jgi:hypothetical protein
MKAASVSEIKKELTHIEPSDLRELCLRLVKYKKENKELLTYLLFEAHREEDYIQGVQMEIEAQFDQMTSKGNLYLAKKSIRKILRFANKQIKYSGIKKTELELRIYFCRQLKDSGIKFRSSAVLVNLYQQQLKKISAILGKLPEDLQYDYEKEIGYLTN